MKRSISSIRYSGGNVAILLALLILHNLTIATSQQNNISINERQQRVSKRQQQRRRQRNVVGIGNGIVDSTTVSDNEVGPRPYIAEDTILEEQQPSQQDEQLQLLVAEGENEEQQRLAYFKEHIQQENELLEMEWDTNYVYDVREVDGTSSSLQDHLNNHIIVAQGTGPEISNSITNTLYKLNEVTHSQWILTERPSFYNILSSSTFTWNMTPYKYDNCPLGNNMFNLNNGFTFHHPDPKTQKLKKQYLNFKLNRRDSRQCLFNGSETCLGGGNFILNLGMTTPDMYAPGVYNVGSIHLVAHNTIRDCSRRWYDLGTESTVQGHVGQQPMMQQGDDGTTAPHLEKKTPFDYLRQGLHLTTNPQRCEAWINEREANNDLFKFNSDQVTVHISTPYMHINIDVRQNKVPTDEECNYATMKVWITDINDEMLLQELREGRVGGILGVQGHGPQGPSPQDAMPIVMDTMPIESYQVDGPFGTELSPSDPQEAAVEEPQDQAAPAEQQQQHGLVDTLLGFMAR